MLEHSVHDTRSRLLAVEGSAASARATAASQSSADQVADHPATPPYPGTAHPQVELLHPTLHPLVPGHCYTPLPQVANVLLMED